MLYPQHCRRHAQLLDMGKMLAQSLPLRSAMPLLLLLLLTAAASDNSLRTPAALFTPTADLPPLLVFENGSAVDSPAAWIGGRRSELKRLLEEHILGAAPVEVPSLLSGAYRQSHPHVPVT